VTIKDGSKVSFHYTLKVDGQVADSSDGREPFQYVHGEKGIVPGLESELEGLEVGDKRDIVVQPEDGYGPADPNALQRVPKSAFGDIGSMNVGDLVNGETPQGSFQARVHEITDDHVTLDLNHPLAGRTLEFQVEIMEVA
jgi:FKBP-type peptidyl-prolyl cis-trans isomerase SlyD